MKIKLFTDMKNLALHHQNKAFWATKKPNKDNSLVLVEISLDKFFKQLTTNGDFTVTPKK